MTASVTVLAEVGLGVPLELLQHARADLLRRVVLAVDVDCFQSVPMCALDRPDGAVDVGDRLALGDLADEHLAVLGERDDGRGGARALGVGDDRGLAALQDGDTELVVPRSMPTARAILGPFLIYVEVVQQTSSVLHSSFMPFPTGEPAVPVPGSCSPNPGAVAGNVASHDVGDAHRSRAGSAGRRPADAVPVEPSARHRGRAVAGAAGGPRTPYRLNLDRPRRLPVSRLRLIRAEEGP